MEIITVFGVKWRIASYWEVAFYFFLFALLIAFFALLRYNQHLKNKKVNEYEQFLFKMKRMGLTNFQTRIINNMVRILQLSDPNQILTDFEIFELAIEKFIPILIKKNEQKKSLSSVYKNITMTYEKLYHPASYNKPLDNLHEVEDNQMLFFATKDKNLYLGKIKDKDANGINIHIFLNPEKLQNLSGGDKIRLYIWRIADAEYAFTTKILKLENNVLTIETSDEFTKGKEFRHPYIDVMIPTTLTKSVPDDVKVPILTKTNEEPEEIRGTIFRLNDGESIIRLSKKLDYKQNYFIEFELMDFSFKIKSTIIADTAGEGKNIIHYTMKFQDVTNLAQNILKKFIKEHL